MKRSIAATAFLFVGLVVGGLISAAVVSLPGRMVSEPDSLPAAKYTCSMHPQVIIDHPDVCPLCGMDSTPVRSDGAGWEEEDPGVRLVLSAAARRMADVGSTEIHLRELFKEINTVGKVDFDETRVVDVAARLRGPIQQIFADFPGTMVREGDRLVSIFGTEVYPGQQEYLFTRGQEAAAQKQFPGSSLNKFYLPRRRLEYWGMTDKQIENLASRQTAEDYLEVCAPISGTIVEKKVRLGQFVQEGEILYTIADLSQVWLVLEVYESELAWLRLGQPVQITLESEPHRPATGKVGFIEPVVNDATRSVRVRVILENSDGRFKPGMYAQTLVRVPVLADGTAAPTGMEGKYLCPMHPYDVVDKQGACRHCGMPLEQVPGPPAGDQTELSPSVLAMPADALLTTGRRQLAYLEVEPGKYLLVEPKLGPRAGDYYPVISGLKEGDRVVTRGSFLLDSQFQITGKSSLLRANRDGGAGEGFTAKQRANLETLSEADRRLAIAQKICPNCGMSLGDVGKPCKTQVNDRVLFLCGQGCEKAVKRDSEAALKKIDAAKQKGAKATADCDCRSAGVTAEQSANVGKPPEADHNAGDLDGFTAEEWANIRKLPEADRHAAMAQRICPITGMKLGSMGAPYRMEILGRPIYLCCQGCEESVKDDPDAAFKKIEAAKKSPAKTPMPEQAQPEPPATRHSHDGE